MNEKGDTLVEVLLALSVLSLVLFTSWSVVNRATQISTAARQRVAMVDQLKEQAELIQTERDSISFLTAAVDKTQPAQIKANSCDEIDLDDDSDGVNNKFYLMVDGSGDITHHPKSTKAATRADSGRVWVQYVEASDDNGDYVDFYIRGCWRTSGGQQRTDTSQFILRLNTT